MERNIERKLYQKIKEIGGLALKFISPSLNGVPDRIVLLPKGQMYFVELKDNFEKPSPSQLKVHEKLRKLGFDVRVVDSMDAVEKFIDEVVKK